jgi:hypothetical protein
LFIHINTDEYIDYAEKILEAGINSVKSCGQTDKKSVTSIFLTYQINNEWGVICWVASLKNEGKR